MFEISYIKDDEIQTVSQFQVLMAKETENKDLNLQEVIESLNFLIKNKQFGFIIVAKKDKNIIGSLMVTYEYNVFNNSESLWIQSVFVIKQSRNQGAFTQLFNFVKDIAVKQKSSVKLYAETENNKAIQVYQRLGLQILQFQFIEKDFYFDKSLQIEKFLDNDIEFFIINPLNEKIDFQNYQTNYQRQIENFQQITEKNLIIRINQNEKPIGYAFLFLEFSDWRNGFIVYVYEIMLLNDKNFENISKGVFNFIKNNMKIDLEINTIRNIIDNQNQNQIQTLQKQGFQIAHYYLMGGNF